MAKRKKVPKSSASAATTGSAKPAAPKHSFASMFPGFPSHPSRIADFALSPDLVNCIEQLEQELKVPVWMLVQDAQLDDPDEYNRDTLHMIGDTLAGQFFGARHGALKKGEKIAVLVDSNGGKARSAYELAMLLRRHCGGFIAVIPRHAKSAATLFSLGADEIVMNDYAELEPLDVQIWDPDREEPLSGLDEVQALEQLNTFAMGAFDKLMMLLLKRTRKKANSLMPVVSEFVTRMTEPMFDRIDVVRFTQMSRALKIAEEYAKRLLVNKYGADSAEIARRLVEDYPEHGFPIYSDEIRSIGLKLATVNTRIRPILEELTVHLSGVSCVGRIVSP